MARRKLEEALQVGKQLSENPDATGIELSCTYQYPDYKAGIFSLAVSEYNEEIIAGYGDGCLQRLSIDGKKVICESEGKPGMLGGFPITVVRLVPSNNDVTLAASADGKLYLWKMAKGKAKEISFEKDNEINTLDISPDTTSYATAGSDHCVRIYDLERNKCLRKIEGFDQVTQGEMIEHAPACRIFALRFDPQQPNIFITGGWDNQIKVWDKRRESPVVRNISGPHVCGDALDIRGDQILSGSWVKDNSMQLWSLSLGKLISDLPVEPGKEGEYIYSCRFCGSSTVVAGGSGTRNVQLIDSAQLKVLGKVDFFDKVVNTIDASPDGNTVAFGGGGQELCIASTFAESNYSNPC